MQSAKISTVESLTSKTALEIAVENEDVACACCLLGDKAVIGDAETCRRFIENLQVVSEAHKQIRAMCTDEVYGRLLDGILAVLQKAAQNKNLATLQTVIDGYVHSAQIGIDDTMGSQETAHKERPEV